MSNEIFIPQIVDTTYYSIGFPQEPQEGIIPRENYHSELDDLFKTGANLIILEGEEDAGKTTICAQYAKRNPISSVSVFFNPHNNLDYSIDFFCSNVVFQLKYLLGEKIDLETEITFGKETYQQYIFHIRKKYKGKTKVVFIIDGLENKFKDDNEFILELCSILPFGQNEFQFLIAGNEIDIKDKLAKIRNFIVKKLNVTGLSEPELLTILGAKYEDIPNRKEIYKITKGLPGRIRTLKSILLTNNYTIDQLTQSKTYKSWIELDCQTIDLTNREVKAIISLLALTNNSFSIEDVSDILDVSEEIVKSVIKNTALEVVNNVIYFISFEHKRHFQNILRGNEKRINELLINFYSAKKSADSLLQLPKLYAESKDWDKIMNILDENYVGDLITRTGSAHQVTNGLSLGMEAAEKSNNFPELFRYSLESSMVNELDNYVYWESEIKARIAIHDFSGAISLAESAILKIDRLKLLALVAKKQKEANDQVDEDLVSLIGQLYNNVDFSTAGDKIYDIVADLLFTIPNLAIDLIESSSESSEDKSINEWIIAKLYAAALNSKSSDKEDSAYLRTIEAIQGLNNPNVDKISKSISLLVANYTATKVIEEAKKIPEANERVKLLRLWLSNFRGNDESLENVILLGIEELIKGSLQQPVSFEILKELTEQLPFVVNSKIKDQLYYKFKDIANGITIVDSTKDKISFYLNLFQAEYSLDSASSISSLDSIIKEIEQISDKLTQMESYSDAYSKISGFKGEYLDGKVKFIYSRILSISKELLSETASHYNIIEYTLKTISKANPILSLKIVANINLKRSREHARFTILKAYLKNSIKRIKIDLLREIKNSLENASSIERFIIAIISRYAEAKSLPTSVVSDLLPVIRVIDIFSSASAKTFAYVQSYIIISKNTYWKPKLQLDFANKIFFNYQEIESDWEKIEAGFSICSDVSKYDSEFAKKMFESATNFKKSNWIDSSQVAFTYILSVRIVLKSTAALIAANNFSKADRKVIEDLMARIPSDLDKLSLWTELGFICYNNAEYAYSKDIYNYHVLPSIDSLIRKGMHLNHILDVFTFVHLQHAEKCKELIRKLPSEIQEKVYNNICDFYITNECPYDIYDQSAAPASTNYTEILKAILALAEISTDYLISWQVGQITKSIVKNRDNISKVQCNELLDKLTSIVNEKLPDKTNIQHEGYKVVCLLRIGKARREIPNQAAFWNSLLESSSQINNTSDLLLVKSIFLDEFPFEKITSGINLKAKMYADILDLLDSMPSFYEFIQRVIHITDTMYVVNRNSWKQYLRKAFTITFELNKESDVYNSQRKILDSIYKMDKEFAKELVKISQEENRAIKYNRLLQKHIEFLEISRKIKNNETLEDKEKQDSKIIVKSVVEALKQLNSGKISSKKAPDASLYLGVSKRLSHHELFPVYIYFLTNCAKTYSSKKLTGVVADIHRDNFKKAVKVTNLIEVLSHKKKGNEKYFRKFFLDEAFSTNIAIHPLSKEEAINYIRSWLVDNMSSFLIVADPYFSKEDLEILKIVNEIDPKIEVSILASKFDHSQNIETEFKNYWKKISDQYPPFTNITYCWIEDNSNATPFHDRWLITKDNGLRLGTSINSLGKNKESELSVMSTSEAATIQEETLLEYLDRRKRVLNGMRVSYKGFSL